MFLIKRTQFEQIKKARRDNYLNHFVTLIRNERLVNGAIGDAEIKSKIDAYYLEAKKFNFLSEKNINVFVYASFAMGARFYERDEYLGKVLADLEMAEEERAAILEKVAEDSAAKTPAE
jgi:hypothetical protein